MAYSGRPLDPNTRYEHCGVCEEQEGSWNTIKSNGIVFCTLCWLREGIHIRKMTQRILEEVRPENKTEKCRYFDKGEY